MGPSEFTGCYRHPDRRAGVICQRCDRPICGACMQQAAVGFHCPECTASGSQQVHRGPIEFEPRATKALLAINVVISLVVFMEGGGRLSFATLADYGLNGPLIDTQGEAYRILTSGFLHDGFWHIGANMWALWIVGPMVERAVGTARFVGLYLAALAAGSFGALLIEPTAFTVGASGAIFGLFGAAVVIAKFVGNRVVVNDIGAVVALNLILTFALPVLSVGGHVGGLLGGAGVAAIYVVLIRRNRPERDALIAVVGVMAVIVAGALWAASLWTDPIF